MLIITTEEFDRIPDSENKSYYIHQLRIIILYDLPTTKSSYNTLLTKSVQTLQKRYIHFFQMQ